MVPCNQENSEDDSFTRRLKYRATVKNKNSYELRQKMNILRAISVYRFKDFGSTCIKLSDTALNCLNKEILVKTEMYENDVITPSKLLENETFLKELKNDIISKKCRNWNLKIDGTLSGEDLSEKMKIPINEQLKNVDEVIEKSTTLYTRLNEEIQDLREDLESLECKSYLMDTPKQKSVDFRYNCSSLASHSKEFWKKRLTNSMPGVHQIFQHISKEMEDCCSPNRKNHIANKLDEAMRYEETFSSLYANIENVNKNKKKNIEKPKRMKPNLESTMKSLAADSTKKPESPFSIPSSISTILPIYSSKSEFGEKSVDKYSYGSSEMTESILPLEMHKFLDNALNNDLPNNTTSYIFHSTCNKTYNLTNSYEDNGNHKNIDKSKTTPTNEETVNERLLSSEPPPPRKINKKTKLLRSFSQEINKKVFYSKQVNIRTVQMCVTFCFFLNRDHLSHARTWKEEIGDSVIKHKDKIQELLQRLEIQQTLIHQASKALNFCNFTKMFQYSVQHVESERLLLLSMLKKKAVLNEIKRIDEYQDGTVSLYEHGKVTISQISLTVNKDKIDLSGLTPDTCGWFMVTVTHESTVWATTAINYSFDSPITIRFPESITVPNLSPHFVIVVDVYSLQLRHMNFNENGDHQSCNDSITCPSPTNLWKKLDKSRLKQNEISCSNSIRETSFQLTGYVQLTLQDLHKAPPWYLLSVPSNSILQGKINFKLSKKIKISLIHSGFLTHGDEAGGLAVWNRRWCVLDGSCMKFWNYPQEHDLRPPLLIIDLTCCTTNEVQVVDRTICARPRTLMFKTIRERVSRDENTMFLECQCSYTVVRHLLSCDTIHDMMEWSSKLNYVLSILSNWKSRRNHFIPTTEL
ncbi:PREDICTED: LOW QUALITY PROTEIN: actin-binding protein anillin-like [Polistes dominula]|uniref:LOW QUALITY PROTEIN: actin-binding protein anillin-like n=1 Tax=Polistes dominula TaxID=743375 RepID=A0ABM1J141_POLDO|nr:PREDICTED: LOW QUALITY PROTEIN: actin-binding protein anillin-like [Polistes dominula]